MIIYFSLIIASVLLYKIYNIIFSAGPAFKPNSIEYSHWWTDKFDCERSRNRAIQEFRQKKIDNLVGRKKNHNKRKKLLKRIKQHKINFVCAICFDDKDPKDMFYTPTCNVIHSTDEFICMKCMEQYILSIADQPVDKIRCPIKHCRLQLSLSMIKTICPKSWHQVAEKQTINLLRKDPSNVQCPNCEEFLFNDRACIRTKCPKCHHKFCSTCLKAQHKWRGLCPETRSYSFLMWALWQWDSVRYCPHCHVMAQKPTGCGHVTCAACKNPYEWSSAIKVI